MRDNDEEGYRREVTRGDKIEGEELKKVTDILLKKLKLMEQDYIMSLNYHASKQEFKEEMVTVQNNLSKELFGNLDDISIPESLTREVATEIRDFARSSTNEVIVSLSKQIKDQNVLQDSIAYEIAKLDDVIYLKYGYKNKEVIKAFEKYQLLSQRALDSYGPKAVNLESNTTVPGTPVIGS